ncbi:MAG: hypothetical protein V4726_08885 [Verrucomicrobiota bacterium]
MISPLRKGHCILIGLALASALRAQERVDAARETAAQSEVSGGVTDIQKDGVSSGDTGETAPKMEGDDEYGVQKILYKRSNWDPWTFRFDLGGSYTSNVALVDKGEIDDFYLQSGITLGYVPQIKGGLFGRALLSDQIFRYNDSDFFDFDLLRAQTGLLYAFPRAGTAYDPILGNLIVYADYNFYRISQPWDWGDDNFDNHSISIGADKTWRFSRGHSIVAGVSADWSIDASRPEPQRDEYTAYVAYKVKWTSNVESTVAYRAAAYDYSEADRTDFNQIVSLGLEYKLTDWLRLNTAVSGTFNNSDRSIYDYKAFNAGLFASLVINW